MSASPSSVGIASSGTVRGSPLRAPVVVTIATGSALSRLESMCSPFVARNVSRSSRSRMRAKTHEPGPVPAASLIPALDQVRVRVVARHQRRRARMYFVASAAERASVTAPPWVTPS